MSKPFIRSIYIEIRLFIISAVQWRKFLLCRSIRRPHVQCGCVWATSSKQGSSALHTCSCFAKLFFLSHNIAKINQNMCAIHFLDNFRVLGFFYMFHQIEYHGLDLNRFCAPEHIIEMWNSLVSCDHFVKHCFIRTLVFAE